MFLALCHIVSATRSIIIVALTSICVFTSVLAATEKSVSNSPAVYDESKTSITVLKSQPVFILKLASNPTTGYVWLLNNYDKSLIVPVKHEYQAPNSKLMGAPGMDLWTFRVKPDAFIVPQRTSIHMSYARPWEADKSGKNIEIVVTTQAG
jgi:inhibitor of cysteine peptidase